MTQPTFIEYQGAKRTISEWSRITGIPHGTITHRIRSGWSAERALTKPSHAKFAEIEFQGESRQIAEWAQIVGICEGTIRNRLRTGWSVEDALTRKPSNRASRERHEDYCLNCTVENDCNEKDPRCQYPRSKGGNLMEFASLYQNWCGVKEKQERAINCK